MDNTISLRAALGGMIAMGVAVGIGRFVYTPILPPMIAALGLSKATAGLIASANFAGYLAGALGAARASLPGPRRWWLLGALVISAVTTAAMGYDGGLGWFLAVRFAGGVASALVLILATALVLETLAKAGRPGLGAVHFAGVGVGIALSAALVAGLAAYGADWASMWAGSGAVSCVGLLAVALLLPNGPEAAAHAGPAKPAQRDGHLTRMTIAYGLFGFGYVITATFLVAIVRATPSVRALEPVIWILVGLGAAPSVWLWSLLGRRIGTARAFAAAALTEAVGVLASVASTGALSVCLGAVLLGGTFMGLTALGLTRARELATGDPRRAMAAMTGAFGAGQIVGPVVAGLLSDALGGFVVPSVAAAVGLAVAAWLARR